jgi:hypothetical protein
MPLRSGLALNQARFRFSLNQQACRDEFGICLPTVSKKHRHIPLFLSVVDFLERFRASVATFPFNELTRIAAMVSAT